MSHIKPHNVNKPHWVYLIYDSNGQLLYIGCTVQSPLVRLAALTCRGGHLGRTDATHMEAVQFPTGPQAMMEEGRLIDELQPPHNRARSATGLRRAAGLPVEDRNELNEQAVRRIRDRKARARKLWRDSLLSEEVAS